MTSLRSKLPGIRMAPLRGNSKEISEIAQEILKERNTPL